MFNISNFTQFINHNGLVIILLIIFLIIIYYYTHWMNNQTPSPKEVKNKKNQQTHNNLLKNMDKQENINIDNFPLHEKGDNLDLESRLESLFSLKSDSKDNLSSEAIKSLPGADNDKVNDKFKPW